MKNPHNIPESIAPGETLAGVQLCPFGEFPNGKSMQLCDEVAFNQIVVNHVTSGAKEVLCDFEHKSEDPSLTSDTAAAAWISNLAVNKERGLVGDLKFTDLGAEAVTNRRLRFLSPVWTLDADGRPDRLRSVALTNKPNIPVACVLNREPTPHRRRGRQESTGRGTRSLASVQHSLRMKSSPRKRKEEAGDMGRVFAASYLLHRIFRGSRRPAHRSFAPDEYLTPLDAANCTTPTHAAQ